MKPVYGFAVVRTRFGGGVEKFEVNGCSSSEEAVSKAYKWADESGWKPPRWWQWWRFGDTRELTKQFPNGIKNPGTA